MCVCMYASFVFTNVSVKHSGSNDPKIICFDFSWQIDIIILCCVFGFLHLILNLLLMLIGNFGNFCTIICEKQSSPVMLKGNICTFLWGWEECRWMWEDGYPIHECSRSCLLHSHPCSSAWQECCRCALYNTDGFHKDPQYV